MTIVLLASVSLFALVINSRPILPLPSDARFGDLAPVPSALQAFFQTPFRIHSGKDDLTSDAARFHFQKSKQQLEFSSDSGKEAVAVIASFQIPSDEPPAVEVLLDESPGSQDTLAFDDERDDGLIDDVTNELAVEFQVEESHSTPLVVLVLSCLVALLALACIGLSLYTVKWLRSHVLASKTAWELLPRFWRRSKPQENTGPTKKQRLSGGHSLLLHSGLLSTEEESGQRYKLRSGDRPVCVNAVSDMESEWDDVDEKYQDALDLTPLPLIHDLPLQDSMSNPSHYGNPPSPHSMSVPLNPWTDDRSTPLMRESRPSSPLVRPAWSVRAFDSPALGLSSQYGGVDATPQPLIHPRRRAYRSPVPEFDVALAMQLRPGLGIGADPAWMVRFLMAIFGWFAVALTGNTR